MSDEEFERSARSGDPTQRSELVREARRARVAEIDLQGQVVVLRSTCRAAADRMEELREDIQGLRKELEAERARAEMAEQTRDGLLEEMKESGTIRCVLAFAELMEAKLSENRHKGDREGWTRLSKFALTERLADEVLELNQSIRTGTAQEIARECADVANFAMMIADVVGGLKP